MSKYKNLMLAPINMRLKLKQLISREIKNAKEGKPASLFFKINNLVDKEIIKKLYEASVAGVEIRLIVRGICCLLYTSDAADERSSVDLGGRRIIKKKKQEKNKQRYNQ